MPLTKEEFLAVLDRAAGYRGVPVATALFRALAEDLRKGEPAWWAGTRKAWAKRRFVAWDEPWGLFLNAVHAEALGDADSPLVPYFPSCGGTAEADPAPALRKFLASAPPSFFDHLETGQWRPYSPVWSGLWKMPASLFFQKRFLPYYLVELNAGAGLDLVADSVQPNKHFMDYLVSARIGLEPSPLLVEDIGQRRWLTGALFPDDLHTIGLLDKACESLLGRQKSEAAFVQLVPCPAAAAPEFLAKNIPADDPEVGLLVFNGGTTARMDDASYASFMDGMLAMMKPWGDRALWFEVERVRGEVFSTTYQLRARRYRGPKAVGQVLGRFDLALKTVEMDQKKAEAFLEAPIRK